MNDISLDFLHDLAMLLKEKAMLSKEALVSTQHDSAEYQFELGRLTCYSEVLSLIQQQSIAFGLTLDQVALSDINPETDLLGE